MYPRMLSLFQIYVQQLKRDNDESGKKGELTNWTALMLRREEINGSFKGINEDIHLHFCIVKVETCTGTCLPGYQGSYAKSVHNDAVTELLRHAEIKKNPINQ